MKISTKLDTVIPPSKTVTNENTDASQCKKNKMFTQKELIDTLKPKKDSLISSDKKRLPLKQVTNSSPTLMETIPVDDVIFQTSNKCQGTQQNMKVKKVSCTKDNMKKTNVEITNISNLPGYSEEEKKRNDRIINHIQRAQSLQNEIKILKDELEKKNQETKEMQKNLETVNNKLKVLEDLNIELQKSCINNCHEMKGNKKNIIFSSNGYIFIQY